MLKIGLTGGIGSGKSTIARVFETLHVPLYSSDVRAKELVTEKVEIRKEIISLLGEESYFPDHTYNRAFVAAKVFQDPELLQALNRIIHPVVAQDFEEWCLLHSAQPYVLKEAALLLDTASAGKLDYIIVIYASSEVRMKRILKRDPHRSQSDIQKIFNNQKSEEYFIRHADFVIYNDEQSLVIPQILDVHQKLISLANGLSLK